MKECAWRTCFNSFLVFILVPIFSTAAVPTEKLQKENQIKTVVQEVFREHGYDIEKDRVVLIEDHGRMTVAMDVSDSIANSLSDEILDKVVALDLSFLNTTLEMNIFGSAVGVRDGQIRKNAIDPQWKDALSRVQRDLLEEREESEYISSPAFLTEDGFLSAPQNSGLEKARAVILVHLLKIKEKGQMLSTVLMENYWKDVFSKANAMEFFDVGRPLLSEALTAGVKPYREGRPLDATLFADLAMKSLGMEPVQGAGASVILFHP